MTRSQQILSDLVVHKNYAKYIPSSQRRETYDEVVLRTADYLCRRYPEHDAETMRNFGAVLNKEVVPSMRMMQFSGKSIDMMPNRTYNCGFMACDDTAVFHEMMFLLLGGSGIGFSVQKYNVNKLPPLVEPARQRRFMVSDNIIGWADAVKVLMSAYFKGTYLPRFDFSDIRPKGTPLKTSGGRAPGSEPLDKALHNIGVVLKRCVGRRLEPIDVFDIMCHIASAVFAGGIRRAALICLFSHFDEDMMSAKVGNWFLDNPQRGRANISVALNRTVTDIGDKIDAITDKCNHGGYGEPGIMFTSDDDYGYNPCGEIYLKDCSFCNLTEVVYSTDEKTMVKRLRVAAYIGTLQAGFTDFFYLRDKWRLNCESNPLIGVSMTNICSGDLDPSLLTHYNHIVIQENARVATMIGINRSSRVTCVKPSGSTSLVLGTSSGIHPWYAEYFTRTLEIEKSSPLGEYILKHVPSLMLEDSIYNPNNFIVKFPIKAPDGALTNDEDTTEKALERVRSINRYFIGKDAVDPRRSNNTSCTLYMKTPDDWEKVKEFLKENYLTVGGVSMYPYDDAKYLQPVLAKMSKEDYEAMTDMWNQVDLNLKEIIESMDNTEQAQALACAGGACEI